MGLTFKTAEERNPIVNAPAQPPVDPCAEIKAELDLMNQFLEDNGLAIMYDQYKYILDNPELATGAEVIDEDKLLD